MVGRPAWHATLEDGEGLGALESEVQAVRDAELKVAGRVGVLRGNGVPWSVIAVVVGLSPSGAHKRYGGGR